MNNIYKNLISGMAVFLVAIPLCLGIALASGAPMAAGLLGGIIGGLVVGAISGSHTSVSGPAAGLAAVVLSSITEIGSFESFLVAVILAGGFQLILALFKAGGLARFFPNSVIKGLLTAIGIILILKQIPHALGYDIDTEGDLRFNQANNENTFTELINGLQHIHPGAICISLIGLFIMFYWNRLLPKKVHEMIPASLAVVVFAIIINELVSSNINGFFIEAAHRVQLPDGISMKTADKLFTLPNFGAFYQISVWKTLMFSIKSLYCIIHVVSPTYLVIPR